MTILSDQGQRFYSSAALSACPTCQNQDNGTRGTSCDEIDFLWCRIRNEVVADLINDKLKEMRGE